MNQNIVRLSDGSEVSAETKWVDIIRVGNWRNSYKEFEITPDQIDKIIANFDDNVLRLDKGEVQFNYSHASYAEGAGWISALRSEFRDGVKVLQAQVRWTKAAKEKIADEAFKYVSAELDFNYNDEESGERHGITLTGAALTNIPFVRGLKSVDLSDGGDGSKNIFLISNQDPKMEKFLSLAASLKDQESISAVELATAQGGFAMLSDDEQAEQKATLDALEAKVESNDTDAQLSAARTEITDLKAKLADSEQAQTELSTLQSKVSDMELQTRTEKLALRLDGLVEAGKLLPKSVENLSEQLLAGTPEAQESMLVILEGQKPSVDLDNETGTGADVDGEQNLDSVPNEKVQELAQEIVKNENISLAEAVSKAVAQLDKPTS